MDADDANKYVFIGETGWELKWSESYLGFKLENSDQLNVRAIYNDTQEYPLGMRKWTIINDNCPSLPKNYLLLTSCGMENFTCNDGSCIPLGNRCDLIKHCYDNSDEMGCDRVQTYENAYSKGHAPMPKFSTEDTRTKVDIKITDLILKDINYLESSFLATFWLDMTWYDSRVTFAHLKKDQNILSDDESNKLWFPSLAFVPSPGIHRTKRDEGVVVSVLPDNYYMNFNLKDHHYQLESNGGFTPITASRFYSEKFSCKLDLEYFPFDMQICHLMLKVIRHQENFVKLYPICPWDIPLKEDLTVGEYRIYKLEGYQPSLESWKRNKTKIAIKIHIARFIWGRILTTYLPVIFLLAIVQMTFYFPEDNFQARITVSLSCLLILATLFGITSRSLPETTQITFLEIWMIMAVLMTFLEIVLHTAISYFKECERNKKRSVLVKINDVKVRAKECNLTIPFSTKLNCRLGQKVFPIAFLFGALLYVLAVLAHYMAKNHVPLTKDSACIEN